MSDIIASLIAKISADTSSLDTGLASANSKLQSTARNMTALGGSFPGDELGADFAKYTRGVSAASANLGAMGVATDVVNRKNANLLGNLHHLRMGWMNIAFAIGGVVAAGAAVKAVYDLGEQGAEIDYTANKFDRLSKSAGITGDVLMTQLRGATKGTVSDFGLMKQTADLFQLGLANDANEAIRLSRVMTALGMDTGQLVLAIANQSKRRLDQLGISLVEFNKQEAKFKEMGLGKEEAFKQAFLATAEQTVLLTGNKADEAVGSYSRLKMGWENWTNAMKTSVGDTFVPMNNTLGAFFDKQAQLSTQTREDTQWRQKAIEGYREYLRLTGQAIQQPAARAFAWQRIQDTRATAIRKSEDMGIGGAAAAAPEVDTTNYENVLKMGVSLTDMYADQQEKLGALSEKLTEAEQKYGHNSKKVKELRQDMQDLTTEMRSGAIQTMQEMELATMKNNGATDQQQISFARASGLMSEGAFQQSMALAKLSDAYIKGKLTANELNNAVGGVYSGMKAMDGFNAVSYVDVYIRVHGGGDLSLSGNFANVSTVQTSSGTINRRASGGPLGAGEIAGVTEYGQPEVYESGGRRYLIAGKSGGYVSTMNRGGGMGGMEQIFAMMSRMPSEQGIARALAKEMARYWPRSV